MYKEVYSLSEKPFEGTPDPRFVYFTPSYRNALTAMIDGIKNRAGFISASGEAGTGKTTLVHCLLSRLDEKVKTVYIFHSTITFKELLKYILLELGLRVVKESNTTLLHRLAEYLTQMDADETIAVIIDEGQNLPDEVMQELQMFSNLKPKVIQILLVGQPELEEKLNSPSLRHLKQKIGIRCQISALNEKESKEYIDHRLRLVGSSSSETFTPEAISMICLYAKGIPRIINVLCDNAFLIGYNLSKREIDAGIIREVIKNLEGPVPRKAIPHRIVTAVKEFRLTPFGSNFFLGRASLIILSLICLGGLILSMHGPFQLRRTNALNTQSQPTNNLHVDTKISLMSSFPEQNPKSDKEDALDEQDRFSFEPPQSIAPQSASPTTKSGSNILKEVIAVEKGQTLFALARKYYGMANITLIDLILDFNPEIANAHLVKVNQTIKIPKITKQLLIIQSSDLTYKIHVGTFWIPGLAEVYRDEPALKEKEIEILLRKVSPEDNWYRVVVGPFGDKDECLKVIDQLKEKGLLPAFGGIPKRDDMAADSTCNSDGALSSHFSCS